MPCEEANMCCDKSQYDEAGIWDKIKLNLHLLYCAACRSYSKNNAKLSKLMKNKNVEYLTHSEKEEIQKVFSKEYNQG